jgi:dTDP-4-amino-4,6-dideoxygalactose transaminase
MSFRVPLNKNTLGPEEIQAAKAVLDSGQLTMGQQCSAFERAFERYLGVNHAIMVNSGSSANLLALFALANPLLPVNGRKPLTPGCEVIVPALTWSTTIWPVVQTGAKPVFVDCDPDTLQMRPEAIARAITPSTVAIVIVHVLGGAIDIAATAEIAQANGLWLFEDTCEALGVLWDGRHVGTFGQMGSYSFYFSHHITTIEGGMIVTNDDTLADLLRALRAHGWSRHMRSADEHAEKHPDIDSRFLFITTGFNVRPTEINAAIGLEQIKRLDEFNVSRRRTASRLNDGLAALIQRGHIEVPRHHPRCTPAPFGYTVLCRTTEARNGLRAHLEQAGVETRPVICGNMVRQPALSQFAWRVSGGLDGADRVMDHGLYWGIHPHMTDEDVDYIVDTVKGFFQ